MRPTPGRARAFAPLAALLLFAAARAEEPIVLPLASWTLRLDPATLAAHADRGDQVILLSAPQAATAVTSRTQTPGAATFTRGDTQVRARALPGADAFELEIAPDPAHPGPQRWPFEVSAVDGLLVPVSEGLYLPATDPVWVTALAEGESFTTHGGLGLPALGHLAGPVAVDYVWPDGVGNEIQLSSAAGRLRFAAGCLPRPRDGAGPYRIRVSLDPPGPLAPALAYRASLPTSPPPTTLRAAAATNPAVARLFGATHAYLTGDGRKPATLDRLKALGLTRMALFYDQDPKGDPIIVGPETIAKAKALGWLIGPYDTHDNVQPPGKADTPLSDYGPELYAKGGIMKADGTRQKGFSGRGFQLSSAALAKTDRFQARVATFRATGIDAYFLDCDAFGDLFDDYDPAHPMTKREDQAHRLARMDHASRTCGLVTGSESAAAWSVPVLHFSHGPHTIQSDALWPVLSDKQLFGGWTPWQRADIFYKELDTPPRLAPYFDPRYRVPLYQAAFHDRLVSTDRWEFTPVKLRDRVQVRALTQLLYGVPPIWALDARAVQEHGPWMAAHDRFFGPLHQAIGPEPLTAFEWLTPDRLVQRTRFGSRVELTANFSPRAFDGLEPLSIRARWLADGRVETYRPPGQPLMAHALTPADLAGPVEAVAPTLLGCLLHRRLPDGSLRTGRITEVEAYAGPEDLASHARFGPQGRAAPMFGPPGHAYVYLIYGLHHCFNVVTGPPGQAAAVLVRALEPVAGLDPRLDGPGRLTKAMGIDRSHNGLPLTEAAGLWITVPQLEIRIVRTPRIGISYAPEPWLTLPWRFCLVDRPP